MNRPFNRRIWLIDMLVLVVFAAIGRQSHGEGNPLSAIVMTAAPFALAWSLMAYLTGVLAPQPRIAWLLKSAGTNVVACALALVLRALWLHRDSIPWTFALVALSVTTVFLLVPRLFHPITQESI